MIFLMLMDCAVGCCCCSSRSEFFASGPTSLVVAPIAGPFIIGQQSIHACFEPFQQPTSDRWNTFSYYQKIKVKYAKTSNFQRIQRRYQFTGPNFFSLHNHDMIIDMWTFDKYLLRYIIFLILRTTNLFKATYFDLWIFSKRLQRRFLIKFPLVTDTQASASQNQGASIQVEVEGTEATRQSCSERQDVPV